MHRQIYPLAILSLPACLIAFFYGVGGMSVHLLFMIAIVLIPTLLVCVQMAVTIRS